jgi:DNA-directed RNA polymerase sigma subunit (sigma70/sigma32)
MFDHARIALWLACTQQTPWGEQELTGLLQQWLSPREHVIIASRYGLYDGCVRDLRSIGRELGISGERVRQIEGDAMRKIQAHMGSHSPASPGR